MSDKFNVTAVMPFEGWNITTFEFCAENKLSYAGAYSTGLKPSCGFELVFVMVADPAPVALRLKEILEKVKVFGGLKQFVFELPGTDKNYRVAPVKLKQFASGAHLWKNPDGSEIDQETLVWSVMFNWDEVQVKRNHPNS